jgi:hypothetical protein
MDAVDQPSGVRLMAGDATVILLVLNDIRRRVLSRLFGVSEDQAMLITLIALGLAARTTRQQASRVPRPSGPSGADAAIGSAILREGVFRIAGEGSRNKPFFASLLAFALVAKYHPVLRGARLSLREVRASSRKVFTSARGRYGPHASAVR